MASLALGLAGAAAGSVFGPLGAQVGWMLGAALGSALFPQKIQGPRLDDLKLHNSTYGQMTPFVYGTMRVAGNVIDEQPELTEHSETSGGKGGPETTNYTYTCSFAVRLCEGPIVGVRRIWANGRLVYDTTGFSENSGNLPMTIYLGDETQLPDPTLEIIHGAGNVPAYRGVAYVVFTDWELTEFGNALPNLNFEVYTSAGEIPIRISTWDTSLVNEDGVVAGVTIDHDTNVITIASYPSGATTGEAYHVRHYTFPDGTPTGTDFDGTLSSATPTSICYMLVTNLDAAFISCGVGGVDGGFWFVNGVQLPTAITVFPGPITTVGIYQNGYVYAQSFAGGVSRWVAPNGIPGQCDVTYAIPGTDLNVHGGTDGSVWVHAIATNLLYHFEADLTLVQVYDMTLFPSVGSFNYTNGFFYYAPLNILVGNLNNFSDDRLNLFTVGDTAMTRYPQERDLSNAPTFEWARGSLVYLGGGYILGKDGIALLAPPADPIPLSVIVGDLSDRAGLDESQYDVSGLPDLVDGYLVSQQATSRDMIQPLRDTYFFDAVERDGAVVFVKRDGEPVIAIPDDELAAHGDGEGAPPIVATVRAQEVDLPCVVNIDYVNPAADYQTGSQAARRQVTQSQAEVSLNLPISMTDVKAKAVADTQLYTAWVERNRFSFFTSRKYAAYEPTDVVTVGERDMRVLEKNETRPGVVKWDAVESLAQALTQGGGAVPGIGFTPSPPGGVVVTGPTTAHLLDLPLIAEADNPDGLYAGLWWAHGSGSGLYKSSDGVTYASIASTTVRAVLGTTSDAPGDFFCGNTFDEVNWIDVVVLGGELVSVTQEQVLNGANLAVVGDEVIQFSRAELTDVDTYRLTGLLRGRFGTEWAMAGHGAAEAFTLLPVIRAPSPHGDLYQLRSYKAVTFGKSLDGAVAQTFTNTGIAWQPYAPVLLGGGTDGSGDVALSLTRRTRIGGEWAPFTDVPLGETSERYVWQIWNADFSQVARIIETTSPTTTYSSANQVTDFGAQQQTIYFTAAQVGSIGMGRQARGSVPGAGVSIDDPLAPIPPYHSPTSGSGVPPPAFDAINMTLTWGALGTGNVRANSAAHGDFDCSKVLVTQFTTPSTTAVNQIGRIQAVESVDGPVARTACLSRVAGDFSGTDLGPGSLVQSSSATVQFSVGSNTSGRVQLAASTTYYYNIRNDDGHGVCTCFTGDCSMFVELAKPHGL